MSRIRPAGLFTLCLLGTCLAASRLKLVAPTPELELLATLADDESSVFVDNTIRVRSTRRDDLLALYFVHDTSPPQARLAKAVKDANTLRLFNSLAVEGA